MAELGPDVKSPDFGFNWDEVRIRTTEGIFAGVFTHSGAFTHVLYMN